MTGSSAYEGSVGVENSLEYYKQGVSAFVNSNRKLNTLIRAISSDTFSVIKAREALKDCRLDYKKIESFTSYFFPSETRFYNAAPKFEVEEPTLELVEPMGLQQIETLLFAGDVLSEKESLIATSEMMLSSAVDLKALFYGFEPNDAQILESLRIDLIRMSVLSIAGYDAPLLKSGIAETAASTEALQALLKPYIQARPAAGKLLNGLISKSLVYLQAHSDFDSFNRMEYLSQFALPVQKQLGLFTRQQFNEINTSKYLNLKAEHIYSKDALRAWDVAEANSAGRGLVALGKQLFFDPSLSGNRSVSCASCHKPDHFFSDATAKSPAIQADSVLKRNTPTLLYAGWQHSQFWDGRSADLKEQITTVIFNPLEMNGNRADLTKQVFRSGRYKSMLSSAFPGKKTEEMGVAEVSEAIAAFVKQLSPMNSPFDDYIRGNKAAMTSGQIAGFNLFMGKARCGSCHFAPYFNSLLPPLFELSEVEILGTPKTDDFTKLEYDNDMGRFDLYRIRYYERAFKTPTVRNSAKTAPYMHNGSFGSLRKVIDFYNKGGGRGLGLDIRDQTLSEKPLNLSEKEIDNLITFIDALTDSGLKPNTY